MDMTTQKPPLPPNNSRLATSLLPSVHFSDKAVLAAYGENPDTIANALERHGQPVPSRNAIQQWQCRERIPRRWLATLAYIAFAERGLPLASLFRKGAYDTVTDPTPDETDDPSGN